MDVQQDLKPRHHANYIFSGVCRIPSEFRLSTSSFRTIIGAFALRLCLQEVRPTFVSSDLIPLIYSLSQSSVPSLPSASTPVMGSILDSADMNSLHAASRVACAMLAPIDALPSCLKYGARKVSKQSRHLQEYVRFSVVCDGCLRCLRDELDIQQRVLPQVVSTGYTYTIRNLLTRQ